LNLQRDIDLINDLRTQPVETPWLEFKSNLSDESKIGKLISALSNAARLEGKEQAFLVWGVEDGTHSVIGTSFDPFSKHVGNQVFELWLRQRLSPAPALQFRTVAHPDGNVILLEIPAPTMAPTSFESVPYIRIGSATPKLSDDPGRYQALIGKMRPYTWELGIALSYLAADDVLRLLDYPSYFSLTHQQLPSNRDHILEKLAGDRLVQKDVGGRWNIFNLGAILFATNLRDFGSSIERKGVRFVRYSGIDRTATVTHRHDGQRGYASGFEGLLSYINGLLPQNEHIGQALRVEHPLFPQLSIRELVANALIHQDMTITGAGPQIELFEDRIEITNPGAPLVDTQRMIDLPPRSRNEALASLMRRMGMCEEQGSGLDKVFREVELFQLPAPLLKANVTSMQVVMYGPRTFAEMSGEERVRACYFHAVLQFMAGERMKNTTLCQRFGIDTRNAAQASAVLKKAMEAELIKVADEDHPRAGYHPWWA
jgi:ATP-dependent DNA helicase RecG